jgi:endonuclease YncB( thermonuclease family)
VKFLAAFVAALMTFALAEPVGATVDAIEDFRSIPVQESGSVVKVADGDTFLFRADGSEEIQRIRMLGINTPEVRGFEGQNFERDQCGGPEASRLLNEVLPPGTRVQLRSRSVDQTNRERLQRFAFALNPATGEYDIDPQAIMASSGLAMWFTLGEDPSLSFTYRALIEQAQLASRGIWNPTFCGPIEQPDARISLIVNWDAPGNDALNLNGESVIVRNIGTSAVDISGWLLRDSSLESWFTFPDGQVIEPNDYRVVFVGSGVNESRSLYMNASRPLFINATPSPLLGDGAYLLDNNTAMRAYFEYPCITDCRSDPLLGKIRITKVNAVVQTGSRGVAAANQEFVDIRNISSSSVLLDGVFLRTRASTFAFPANTTMAPGSRIRVRMGMGNPTPRTQYWGRSRPLLPDAGGVMLLLTARNVEISRKRW